MTDSQRIEKARAQHEAVDATVARTSRGPVARAIQAAMFRYLAAEHYREMEADRTADKAGHTGASH